MSGENLMGQMGPHTGARFHCNREIGKVFEQKRIAQGPRTNCSSLSHIPISPRRQGDGVSYCRRDHQARCLTQIIVGKTGWNLKSLPLIAKARLKSCKTCQRENNRHAPRIWPARIGSKGDVQRSCIEIEQNTQLPAPRGPQGSHAI